MLDGSERGETREKASEKKNGQRMESGEGWEKRRSGVDGEGGKFRLSTTAVV